MQDRAICRTGSGRRSKLVFHQNSAGSQTVYCVQTLCTSAAATQIPGWSVLPMKHIHPPP